MAGVHSDWYGFDVGPNGEVEFVTNEHRETEDQSDMMTLEEQTVAAEVVDLLDGFYGHPEVRPLLPPVCVITKWGVEWLRRTLFGDISVEKFTTEAIQHLDVEANDPMDYVETHTYINEHVIAVQGQADRIERVERVKKVLKKGRRSNFAACIAHEAYNKFGARPMTEANVLVTRRWLQKLLAEPMYKDLRMVDRNIAIDRALFLSFVPTNDFRKMRLAVGSRAWQKRVDPKGLLGGLFGKAFMLVREDIPDGVNELE